MPSSLNPGREGSGGEASDELGEMALGKRIVKVERKEVEDVKKEPVVNLDEVEDVKPVVGKVRRAPLRTSTRIATLATRQAVKQEVQELSPSPPRGRKRVKVAAKVTVKQEKKVKVVKVKKEMVVKEKLKEGATEEVVDGVLAVKVGSDVGHQGEDDPGEVADARSRAGHGNHAHQAHVSRKLSQQLADRARLNDAGQVKATIRIFNFLYLEAIQVCWIRGNTVIVC